MEIKQKLRWRCRRGMKELDVLLEQFLRDRFDALTPAQLTQFSHLLETEDNQLWDILNGRCQADVDFEQLIDIIRKR